jgi:hypothetical protein
MPARNANTMVVAEEQLSEVRRRATKVVRGRVEFARPNFSLTNRKLSCVGAIHSVSSIETPCSPVARGLRSWPTR